MWAAVEELGVPVYLHPREPLPVQQAIYAGYESLAGSAWGFAHETATHAIRLMLSGLFDRHPGVQVILGHLAEGLPFLLPRLEHRLGKQKDGVGLGSARRKVSEYYIDQALCVLGDDPGHADLRSFALDGRIFTLQNLDRWAEAEQTLRQARELAHRSGGPGNAAWVSAAVLRYWLGQWDDALAELGPVDHDAPELTASFGAPRLLDRE